MNPPFAQKARAQEAGTHNPGATPSLTVPHRTSALLSDESFRYTIGDRLKVTFFEQILSGPTSQQSGSKALSALIERSELTGEYVVQQDGEVFLPLLGPIQASGQTPQSLEQALVAELSNQTNAQVRVSIQLLEREPIYITGRVARPGPVKYVPGMTVLHALALALGPEGANGANAEYWRSIDVARERERALKAQERLKKLLVRVDVLKSERDGSALQPSNELVEIAGRSDSIELLATEQRFRTLERAQRAGKQAALDATLAALRNESTIQREKMLQIEMGMKEKAERVQEIVALRTRGATTDVNFHMARSELNEARQRWHDARASIAQIERRLVEVGQEKALLGVDMTFEREREIKDALKAIEDEQVTRSTIASLLLTLPATSTIGQRSERFTKLILRRGPSGLRHLPSNDESPLEPGDVLQVVPAGAELAGTPKSLNN